MLDLSRQADMVGDLSRLSVLFVGMGGANSNVVHAIASMGVADYDSVDFDMTQRENRAPGFFYDMSAPKGRSARRAVGLILGPGVGLSGNDFDLSIQEAIPKIRGRYDVIIVAPDNVLAREFCWSHLNQLSKWYVEVAMGGTVAQTYCVDLENKERVASYSDTFASYDAGVLPCGQRATAALTKGAIPLMVGQVFFDISNNNTPPYYQRYGLGDKLFMSAE